MSVDIACVCAASEILKFGGGHMPCIKEEWKVGPAIRNFFFCYSTAVQSSLVLQYSSIIVLLYVNTVVVADVLLAAKPLARYRPHTHGVANTHTHLAHTAVNGNHRVTTVRQTRLGYHILGVPRVHAWQCMMMCMSRSVEAEGRRAETHTPTYYVS